LARLHHVHLPKLETAGLIERDADRGTVSLAEHPAFRDAGIVDVIRGETTADADELDTLFGALDDPRRRAVLAVLSHQFGTIRSETLAREIGARERDTTERLVPAEDVQRILVSLYHVHLPILSEAGLIEHDPDEETVAYRGHPELRVPWMHSVFGPEFRSSLAGELQ
jgi:DNA-binding transcriptional ArsR family regulator